MSAKVVRHYSPRPAGYVSWRAMWSRCTNPNRDDYERYGGRGITVCAEWKSFLQFISDMGVPPAPKLTIEREDRNGNYEPKNCYWATRKQQAFNRDATIVVAGVSLADAALDAGIPYGTAYRRFKTRGNLDAPPLQGTPIGTFSSLSAAARSLGMSSASIRQRLNAGWTEKEALLPKYETRFGNTNACG